MTAVRAEVVVLWCAGWVGEFGLGGLRCGFGGIKHDTHRDEMLDVALRYGEASAA